MTHWLVLDFSHDLMMHIDDHDQPGRFSVLWTGSASGSVKPR